MKRIFVYRNELLPLSETFIKTQASAVSKFDVRFTGVRRSRGGLAIPDTSLLLTNDDSPASKMRRFLFQEHAIAPRFLSRLREQKPSLIHAHFSLDGTDAMPVAEKLAIPLIVTLHGYDVTTRDEALAMTRDGRRHLRRRDALWRRSAKFLCSCDYILKRAVDLGYPQAKMEVLYSGHDLRNYYLGNEPRNPNLILYVGRLVEKKGCSYLIEAVARIATTHPRVELIVIGEGPLRESLETKAKSLKLNCRFLGSQRNPEPGSSVYDWMRRARVFCMPSVTASDGNTEGQPAVFVEAHAHGLPAVSFATAGIGEAVLDGETGLLASEGNIGELAHCLLRLLDDDAMWNSFSERGKRWVWERFDLRSLTKQLECIYDSIISSIPERH